MYYPWIISVLILLLIIYIYIEYKYKKSYKKINNLNECNIKNNDNRLKFIIINSDDEWLILNENLEFEFTNSKDGGVFTITKKGNLIYLIQNLIYEIGLNDQGKMIIHRCPSAKFKITDENELICNECLYINEKLEFSINKCNKIKIEYIDNPILN